MVLWKVKSESSAPSSDPLRDLGMFFLPISDLFSTTQCQFHLSAPVLWRRLWGSSPSLSHWGRQLLLVPPAMSQAKVTHALHSYRRLCCCATDIRCSATLHFQKCETSALILAAWNSNLSASYLLSWVNASASLLSSTAGWQLFGNQPPETSPREREIWHGALLALQIWKTQGLK